MWGGHAFAWNFHSLPLSDNNSEGGRLLFLQKESGFYWSGLVGGEYANKCYYRLCDKNSFVSGYTKQSHYLQRYRYGNGDS